MRNIHVPHEPQMFLCTNPSFHSWLRPLIQDFYLDEEGIPREDRSNVERYFVMQGNNYVWYNTLEEAQKNHGVGPASGIRSFRAIRATVYDNKPLLAANPGYLANLIALPRAQKLAMLMGSWTAQPESTGFWKREWVPVVIHEPFNVVKRVRAYDLASGIDSESQTFDFTVGVLMSKTEDKQYFIEDVLRFKDRFAGVEQRIFEQAFIDGADVTIVLPVDPGAAGKFYAADLSRRLIEQGYTVKLKPVGNKSKLIRFGPFASMCEAGFVKMLDAPWNYDYQQELEVFTGDGKGWDDQCDASADAFWALKSTYELPTFTLPDFSNTNSHNLQNTGRPVSQSSFY